MRWCTRALIYIFLIFLRKCKIIRKYVRLASQRSFLKKKKRKCYITYVLVGGIFKYIKSVQGFGREIVTERQTDFHVYVQQSWANSSKTVY